MPPKMVAAGGGALGEARELVALVASLSEAGDALTAQAVASKLGVSLERAEKLIELVLTASVGDGLGLPLIEEKDGVSLLTSRGVRGRRLRLTRAETVALLAALDRMGTSGADELRDALYVYGALKNLRETKHLDAVTMKCFDLLSSRQVSACLAFALLNGEGIVAGCEGDIPSAISMMIMNSLSEEGAFMANPAYMDENGNEAIYAHCTVPVSMLSSYSLATHFESGLSFALRGQLKKLPVTAIKVSPDLDDIRAIEGRIADNPVQARLCRTQIKVKFDEPIAPLIHDPYGNHLIFGYGRHKAEIEALKALFCPKGQ